MLSLRWWPPARTQMHQPAGRTRYRCRCSAVENARYPVVKKLLELGARADVIGCCNKTLMHEAACIIDCWSIVVLSVAAELLACGTDVNVPSYDGIPIREAARKCFKGIAALVLVRLDAAPGRCCIRAGHSRAGAPLQHAAQVWRRCEHSVPRWISDDLPCCSSWRSRSNLQNNCQDAAGSWSGRVDCYAFRA